MTLLYILNKWNFLLFGISCIWNLQSVEAEDLNTALPPINLTSIGAIFGQRSANLVDKTPQEAVMFGLASLLEANAGSPAVAMDTGGRVVCALISAAGGQLLLKIGSLPELDLVVRWQSSIVVADEVNVEHVAVSLNNNGNLLIVLEKATKLWYKLGTLTSVRSDNGSTSISVSWKSLSSATFESAGENPSVALADDGTVVVSYEHGMNLFYRVTRLRVDGGNPLVFGPAVPLGRGADSRVAINEKRQVVEVHRSEGLPFVDHSLWSRAGLIEELADGQLQIRWTTSLEYAKGTNPSIALRNDGLVVEVHQDSKTIGADKLWSSTGKLIPELMRIEWVSNDLGEFDEGKNPSVAVANGKAIVVYGSSDAFYSTSLLTDRSRWMQNMPQAFWSKEFWRIVLPATHNSGSFSLGSHRAERSCIDAPSYIPGKLIQEYARMQNVDISQQLSGGVRYFDFRIYYWKKSNELAAAIRDLGRHKRDSFWDWLRGADQAIANVIGVTIGDDDFHVYHDSIGSSVSDILDEFVDFLRDAGREIIVLSFSHFCAPGGDFTEALHTQLIQLIQAKLGEYLYIPKADVLEHGKTVLLKTKLSDIVADGRPKVVVNYESHFGIPKDSSGNAWSWLPIHNVYSNTDNYEIMQVDQLQKLERNGASEQQLFLLSWTLTLSSGNLLHTPRELSKNANRNLAAFLNTIQRNQSISVILVDYFQDSRVSDLAILLNKQRSLLV